MNHKFKADLELVAPLFDGCGFFVESKKITQHLQIAKDTPDVRIALSLHTCNEPLIKHILIEDMCPT